MVHTSILFCKITKFLRYIDPLLISGLLERTDCTIIATTSGPPKGGLLMEVVS